MKYLLIFLVCISAVSAKNNNCTSTELSGHWLFDESEPIRDENLNCNPMGKVPKPTHQVKIRLEEPNTATDVYGNKGTWTSIYGVGIEVTVNYRKYFAYINSNSDGPDGWTSLCNETMTGYSKDVLGHNWACIRGNKIGSFDDLTIISRGKQHQKDPVERKYPKNVIYWKPPTAPVTEETKKLASKLPEEFDWRNVNGVNYLSPVTDQGPFCGSCFAHASVNMLSARIRIATNNTQKSSLSYQQVIDCDPNTDGCHGGFNYVAAGKFCFYIF